MWDGSVGSKGFFQHVLPGNGFGYLWLLIQQLLSVLSNLCAFKSLRSHGTASSHSPSGVTFCIDSWGKHKSLLPKCACSHSTKGWKRQVYAEALPKTSNHITTKNAQLLGLFSTSQPLQIKLCCALNCKRQRQRDRGILDLCSLGWSGIFFPWHTLSCTWHCFSSLPSFQPSADRSVALSSKNLCSAEPLRQKSGREFLSSEKTKQSEMMTNCQPVKVSYCIQVNLIHLYKINHIRIFFLHRNWIIQYIRLFFFFCLPQNVHLYCKWIYTCLCLVWKCHYVVLHAKSSNHPRPE